MDLEDKLRHERIWGVKEGIEQGLRQGLEDGRRQGYEMLLRLVRTGAISMETAAAPARMEVTLETLRAIDQAWIEQVDYLQQLRQVVSGRQYARHNVKYAFHEEAYRAFEKMQMEIRIGMMRNILLGELIPRADGGMRVLYP